MVSKTGRDQGRNNVFLFDFGLYLGNLAVGGGRWESRVPLPEGFDLHKEVWPEREIWESPAAQEGNGKLRMKEVLGEKPGIEENVSALDTKNTSDHEDS